MSDDPGPADYLGCRARDAEDDEAAGDLDLVLPCDREAEPDDRLLLGA